TRSTRDWSSDVCSSDLVLQATGVAATEAVALEDSPNGVWAAKRAGMACVAVPNPLTARLDLSHADFTLRSLTELPLAALLARLEIGRASCRERAREALA